MVLIVLRNVIVATMRGWRPVRHVLRAVSTQFAVATGVGLGGAAQMPIGQLR